MKTFFIVLWSFIYMTVCGIDAHADESHFKWRVDDATMVSRIKVESSPAVVAEILWRLPFTLEADTTTSTIQIFSVEHDMEITNVYVREMTTERLTVAFEPLGSGEYEIYYSPVKRPYKESPEEWIAKYNLTNYPDFILLPKYRSQDVSFRHRPEGNPYDRTATIIRTQMYYTAVEGTFDAYFVPWKYPINEESLLPEIWAAKVLDAHQRKNKKNKIIPDTITVKKGGKTPMQIGVVCVKEKENISIEYSNIPTGVGVKEIGDTSMDFSKGQIRTFWSVVDVASSMREGQYYMSVQLYASSGDVKQIPVVINVVNDDGDSREDYMADFISSVGDTIPRAVSFAKELVEKLPQVHFDIPEVYAGKHTWRVDKNTGLVSSVKSGGKEILASPVLLVFSSANGTRKMSVEQVAVRRLGVSSVKWSGRAKTHDMEVNVGVKIAPYGRMEVEVDVKFIENIDFKNISLEFDFATLLYKAGMGNTQMEKNGVYDVKVKESDDGVWVAGDSVGVCISVPIDAKNAFYAMPYSRISLYKANGVGVAVSTGRFAAKKGDDLHMGCHVQLLPVVLYGEAPVSALDMVYDSCDEKDISQATAVVIKNPLVVYDAACETRIREWHTEGKKVLLRMDGYVLPSGSLLGRALAAMGYGYEYEEGEKYMRFYKTDGLRMPFRLLQMNACKKDYVGGVLFSPRWYRQTDVDVYTQSVKNKKDFIVVMYVDDMGMDALMTAPWTNIIYGEDNHHVEMVRDITGLPLWNENKVEKGVKKY